MSDGVQEIWDDWHYRGEGKRRRKDALIASQGKSGETPLSQDEERRRKNKKKLETLSKKILASFLLALLVAPP